METQFSGPDPVGENYLERVVGRLRAARNQAEEYVGRELLSPPETEEDEENADPDLQQYLDWKREAEQLRQQLCEFPGKSLRPGSPSEFRQSGVGWTALVRRVVVPARASSAVTAIT
jgi:hypothetical protein